MQNNGQTLESASGKGLEVETISVRLQHVTRELREIHESLTSSEEADPRILTDFRDALNRVRNTAWAVEQYANSKVNETDPKAVLSLLAGERVRVTFQLCKLVQGDIANPDIKFKLGQLIELHEAIQHLERTLAAVVVP